MAQIETSVRVSWGPDQEYRSCWDHNGNRLEDLPRDYSYLEAFGASSGAVVFRGNRKGKGHLFRFLHNLGYYPDNDDEGLFGEQGAALFTRR